MTSLALHLDIALLGPPAAIRQASQSFMRCQIATSLEPSVLGKSPLQLDALPHLTPALAHLGEVVRVGGLKVHRLPAEAGERLFAADLASWTSHFPEVAFALLGRRTGEMLTRDAPVCFLEVVLPAWLQTSDDLCSASLTSDAWKMIAPSWLIHWRSSYLHEDTRDHAFESLIERLPCRTALESFTRRHRLEACWSQAGLVEGEIQRL